MTKSDAKRSAGDKTPPHPLGTPRAPRSGPVTKPKVNEGASLGKSANSTAGGAAGQLTPKD